MKNFMREFRSFLYREFIPVTKGLVVLSGVIFLLALIFPYLKSLLWLTPHNLFTRLWTLLTYPLLNLEFFSLLFAGLWFWFVGGSLERSWGSQTYGVFLALVTLITGLLLTLVSNLFIRVSFPIYGLWLPLVSMTWAWSMFYPHWEVYLMGLFPIKARYLAWIMAGSAFFSYFRAYRSILMGLAAISGILVVMLFKRGGPFSQGIRYWAWKRGFSFKGWTIKRKKSDRRDRLRII